jgi:hypothetical protein
LRYIYTTMKPNLAKSGILLRPIICNLPHFRPISYRTFNRFLLNATKSE